MKRKILYSIALLFLLLLPSNASSFPSLDDPVYLPLVMKNHAPMLDDPVYLPLVMKNHAPMPTPIVCQNGLVNSDFEQGSTAGWIRESGQGYELIFYGVGYGGSWGAWMGDTLGYETETLKQVNLQGSITFLSFLLASEANTTEPAYGYLRVWIEQGGNLLWGAEAFNPGNRLWSIYAYDLGSLDAENAELVFYYRGNTPEGFYSAYYLDDVYLEICE